jgi:3-carboxymuconate cyclase
MQKDKYIAYVGTYTHGSSKGIHIFDLDVEAGKMIERKVVTVKNPSYVCRSIDGKHLYSISDEGVEAFKIEVDGDLTSINKKGIDGMRGCYLSVDKSGKFLYVGGYHDGRVTVLGLNEDGSLGEIKDGIFHKGLGRVVERNFRPHVTCVVPTPDGKYLCGVDNGIDQVKIYEVNSENGKLRLIDILRCELGSGPKRMKFSKDGKFAYLTCEIKNVINVYSYDGTGAAPQFELLQSIETFMPSNADGGCLAAALKLTNDGKYLLGSSAGDNSASIYEVDTKSGLLEKICVLPISGIYPKDLDVFPDNRHMISLNHGSDEIRIFAIDYKNKIFTLKGKPLAIETPNCILVTKL